MTSEVAAGSVFISRYPFIRTTAEVFECDGPATIKTWAPGARFEYLPPEGDTECVADAEGAQIITVISTHKPGKYPERVFYTQRWRDPNGKEFGKTKLRTKTKQAFNRLIRGYAFEYSLARQEAAA